MTGTVGVVNYGIAGNIYSIKKAIEAAGGTVCVINQPSDFNAVDKIVIPGVGSFRDAMQELENDGFVKPLIEAAFNKPILGICLGMQILASIGHEYGRTKGLSILEAEVKPVQVDAKVPHMGFNTVDVVSFNPLFEGIEKDEFYFMHSYEMVNYTDVLSLTEYAGHKFVSAIQKGNVFGVQFHPEKSRDAGIQLFKNFLKI